MEALIKQVHQEAANHLCSSHLSLAQNAHQLAVYHRLFDFMLFFQIYFL